MDIFSGHDVKVLKQALNVPVFDIFTSLSLQININN